MSDYNETLYEAYGDFVHDSFLCNTAGNGEGKVAVDGDAAGKVSQRLFAVTQLPMHSRNSSPAYSVCFGESADGRLQLQHSIHFVPTWKGTKSSH